MSTATLTHAPSTDHGSRSWILRAVLVLLVVAALAAGAFVLGRVTKTTPRVPATTVQPVSSTSQSVNPSTCVIAHGFC